MKIAIWAYLDNNIGDDLMIKLIANRFKNHDFYLYTNKSTIRNSYKEYINITIRDTSSLKTDMQEIPVFLSIGGSIFNNMNSKIGIISRVVRLLHLVSLRCKGVKIITLGCNLGPYNNWVGPLLTKLELRLNHLTTVRDKSSYSMVCDFRTIKNCYVANDIVYNLIPEKPVKKNTGLGISAYRSLRDRDNNYDNYYALAKVVDSYIDTTKKNVRIFAFDTENENDISAAFHIYNLCNNKSEIEIIPYLGDERSFLNKFSECERMIAIRFHSAILSDIYKIPFLPIVYSNKMKSWLFDNEYKGDYFDLDSFTIEKISIEKIVEAIVSSEGLFYKKDNSNANVDLHFDEFEKIIEL